jgi:hypothetical protein
MKSKHVTILVILTATAIIGIVMINIQQVSAPRSCGSCTAFKKLTHEFEKAVIDAATNGDPGLISGLLEKYNQDVRALDFTLNN